MSHRRAALAASFVVTISGGCKSTPAGGGSHDASPPTLSRRPDGSCRYEHGFSCPEGASCNPPAPLEAECPASMRDGGAPRGPTAAGKVRIKQKVWAFRGSCSYVPDFFCAEPPASGCDSAEPQKISCRPLSPKAPGADIQHVESFIGKRADGSCTLYPAFTCTVGCKLPVGKAVACDATPPAASFPVEGNAPTPYTAEQIRDATQAGRRYEWRVEEPGQPATTRVVLFTSVDDEGATLVTGPDDEALKQSSPSRVTWEELRKHAEFPAEETSIQSERVKTPAGEFDCKAYTVKKPDGTVLRFYFASELPGAPVMHATDKKGKRVSTSTLIAHQPGK